MDTDTDDDTPVTHGDMIAIVGDVLGSERQDRDALLAERDAALARLEQRLALVERGLDAINRLETIAAAAERRMELKVADFAAKLGVDQPKSTRNGHGEQH